MAAPVPIMMNQHNHSHASITLNSARRGSGSSAAGQRRGSGSSTGRRGSGSSTQRRPSYPGALNQSESERHMLNYAAHGSTDNMTREEALDAFMGALNEAPKPHPPQDRGPPLRQNSSRPHMPAPPQLAPSTSNALETPGRGRSSSCASDAEGGSSPKGPRPTIGVPSKPGQRLSIGTCCMVHAFGGGAFAMFVVSQPPCARWQACRIVCEA